MKKFVWILAVLMIGYIFAFAGTFEHKEGGFSIWFPDDWNVTTEGDVLEAEAPTEDAFAQLLMLEAESLEEAVNAYMGEMSEILNNFRVTSEGEDVEWNGLTVHYVEGEGRIQGVDMDAAVALIQAPGGIVMMVTFNTEAAGKRYRRLLKQIAQSIRAV